MTIEQLIKRGYRPFADFNGVIPLRNYYFSSLGSSGYLTRSGGYLGIYFIKGNVVVHWSLNFFLEGTHPPPSFETVYVKNGDRIFFIETAFNKIARLKPTINTVILSK
jgi:hypothetical protein